MTRACAELDRIVRGGDSYTKHVADNFLIACVVGLTLWLWVIVLAVVCGVSRIFAHD